jgi:hypothetical protein
MSLSFRTTAGHKSFALSSLLLCACLGFPDAVLVQFSGGDYLITYRNGDSQLLFIHP